MLLKNLIKFLPKKNNKITIEGLALNSKQVKKGFIFFAIKGNESNGEDYIHEAIRKGASVIVCSNNCKLKTDKTVVIKTKNIRKFFTS